MIRTWGEFEVIGEREGGVEADLGGTHHSVELWDERDNWTA